MTLSQFLEDAVDVIRVRLCQVRGSSPREVGAEVFVSASGLHGTVGGGQLEYMAVDKARVMLRKGARAEQMDVPLGPEIGQCCGGRVVLNLTLMTAADRASAIARDAHRQASQPQVYVLGAGHVGRALAQLFQHLPVRCILIDARPEELGLAEACVEKRLSAMAEADIRHAPKGSAFIVLTHDHALDFLLTSEALDRADASYVGLIGSATKRARFERFHQTHSATTDSQRLICPIGAASSADKRPEVIAALVVAEVMTALCVATHQATEPAI